MVIVIVFSLLDKGNEAENLQKECFYCITTSLWMTPVNHLNDIEWIFGIQLANKNHYDSHTLHLPG